MLAILLYGPDDRGLRPLTDTTPLPMLPLHRVTLAERQLFWLGQQGITHAALLYADREDRPPVRLPREVAGVRTVTIPYRENDGYLGAILRAFETLAYDGIRPSREVLVVRGSVCCDADLHSFLEGRQKRRGRAGLVISHMEDPSGACLVSLEQRAGGRRILTAVYDRPPLQKCCDDTVEAGIALLPSSLLRRAMPDGDRAAWAALSLPALLGAMVKAGEGPVAEEVGGTLCEIRDPASYYRCNMKLYQRENANARRGGSIIGRDCEIHPSATVTRSVLMDGVKVGEGCAVDAAILCPGVSVGAYAVIRPGCIIGAASVLGNRVSLAHDIHIRAADHIADDVTLLRSQPSDRNKLRIDDSASVSIGTPDAVFLLRFGAAAVRAFTVRSAADQGQTKLPPEEVRIGVTSGSEPECTVAAEALLCGIRAAGGLAVNCGTGFYAMAADHARRYRCALMLTVELRDRLRISLLDRFGMMPNAAVCRRIEGALVHEPQFAACGSLFPAEVPDAPEAHYCHALAQCAGNLEGLLFRCDNTKPGSLLSHALEEAGATRVTEGHSPLSFAFDEAGTAISVTARDDGGPAVTADLWRIAALLLRDEAAQGRQSAAIPYRAPEKLSEIASDAGLELSRYIRRPNGSEEDELRALAAETPYLHDSVYAAARACSLLVRERTNLRSLLSLLPPFYSSSVHMDLPLPHRAALLHALGAPSGEGIRMREAGGTVRVIPDILQGFRIIADAANAEIAGELLALSRERIGALTGGRGTAESAGED